MFDYSLNANKKQHNSLREIMGSRSNLEKDTIPVRDVLLAAEFSVMNKQRADQSNVSISGTVPPNLRYNDEQITEEAKSLICTAHRLGEQMSECLEKVYWLNPQAGASLMGGPPITDHYDSVQTEFEATKATNTESQKPTEPAVSKKPKKSKGGTKGTRQSRAGTEL